MKTKLLLFAAIIFALIISCKSTLHPVIVKTPGMERSAHNYSYTSYFTNNTLGYIIVAHDTDQTNTNLHDDLIIYPYNKLQMPDINTIEMRTFTIDSSNVTPSQSGNSGKFLSTDGTQVSWASVTGMASFGTATVSGTILQTQYTITHGLGYTPSKVFIQPKSSNAAVPSWVDNITSTTFRVTFSSVPVIGTNNISFDWQAYH